ncbi:hypothetical protein ABL78_7173 [Leptomonas seymouri]|uniref:SET domain-containing protein n=1 Tax=Leptomonas seymouri TaxID=5684 RepID=A0A0N1PAM8_LEPSE|nr:hypothetical protein ABL78_7173 [Leptomonas seymouri]|eukprot:KPI83791.1 hypothetical protein ABL78_7173 [Leptomonas seymouri]
MRRLASTVLSGPAVGQLRHCNKSSSSSAAASSAATSHTLTSGFDTRGATTAQKASPTSRKSSPYQPRRHSASGEEDAIASRVAAGRSPHLNTAHQKTRQRNGASFAHGGPHQRQRQRAPQGQSTRQRSTAFVDDTEADGAGAYEAGSSARADLPMVHPGADLPPLRQGRLTEKRVGKFSFVSNPSERASRDFYGHEVPNNAPKPRLPMWASSLTSPALGLVRLVEETWVAPHANNTINSATTSKFVTWLTETVLPADAALQDQLKNNVVLDLRKATVRGVYAKKAFSKGDVVLTIPVSTASCVAADAAGGRNTMLAQCLTLNSEVLAAYVTGPRTRPGLPSYAAIKEVLSVRRSSFDPIPHPIFIDQVHAALLLACVKADGLSSPLHPYIQLLQSGGLFNDERIKELHLGVLDPRTHMEYTEHCNRFRHYLRELHKSWWDSYERFARAHTEQVRAVPGATVAGTRGTTSPMQFRVALPLDSPKFAGGVEGAVGGGARDIETPLAAGAEPLTGGDSAAGALPFSFLPPPSLEDMEWALRVVLSRQKVLPHLRDQRDAFERIQSEGVEGEELDGCARALVKATYALHRHVFGSVEEDRLRINAVDPSSIPTVVPLLDMLQHPPSGVANVAYTVEEVERDTVHNACSGSPLDKATTGVAAREHNASTLPAADRPSCRSYQVVVRAVEDIDEDEELTVAYTKCYSVAYTLYRYGFLALGRREDDAASLLEANRVDGALKPIRRASKTAAVPLIQQWWTSFARKAPRGV